MKRLPSFSRSRSLADITLIEMLVVGVFIAVFIVIGVYIIKGGSLQSEGRYCDGTSLVFEDSYGQIVSVVPNSPECGGVPR